MFRIHHTFVLFFLISCRNPTQAKSYSYSEIGQPTDQAEPTKNSGASSSPGNGTTQGSVQTPVTGQNITALVGGRACTPSETAVMKKLFPKDCYYMRKIPEKGKEVLHGGKCIEKKAQVFVGQKSGEFYFVCYQNLTGFMHEDAFD